MQGKILLLVLMLCISQVMAQLGKVPHATFYNKLNGKNVQLGFNKSCYVKLKPSAIDKLNNCKIENGNYAYLRLINQIGDTLVFKEGKLLANDIEKLFSSNAATGWYISMALTIYVPFLVTYTYIKPEDRVIMAIFFPPALVIANSFLVAYQRKQIQVMEYELIPQNILGKEPKKRWYQF